MPKIVAETLDEHRQLVRQNVFEAFARLIRDHSFDAMSMAQLAAEAGIGRTAIYHHFPDKEAVVVAFASHETDRYIDRLQGVLSDAGSPSERMRAYIRHHLAAGDQFHLGLGGQLYLGLSPESRSQIREHVTAIENVLRRIISDGVAVGEFTVDDVDGCISLLHACLGPRQVEPAVVEAFVMRALGAR